jgi:hypothetical protein
MVGRCQLCQNKAKRVVLVYKWRSVEYNIGKKHDQNRRPTHTQCYILCFCGTQGHRALFPAAPGNHGKIQGKITTRCALPVHCTLCSICIGISLQTQVHTGGISQAISNCAWYIYLNTCFIVIQ